jgi:hypothetical protein
LYLPKISGTKMMPVKSFRVIKVYFEVVATVIKPESVKTEERALLAYLQVLCQDPSIKSHETFPIKLPCSVH